MASYPGVGSYYSVQKKKKGLLSNIGEPCRNIPKGTAKEFSADKLFACSCFTFKKELSYKRGF